MLELTPNQRSIVALPLDGRTFLSGPASCGKTTAAVGRLRSLLEQGVPGQSILVLTPQRTLQEPYLHVLADPLRLPGGEVTPATVGGLARRLVDLFWPQVAEAAGFAHPERSPVFLTLETAQYYMAHLVHPLLEQGLFASLTIDRNRLYSQLLDNLNKAAAVGFPHTAIGSRLDSAWYGDPAQRRVYADAQECASRFRQFCLAHNLLDFSLQLEVFWHHLWPDPIVREYLVHTWRHLVYDNVEEDIPRAHDLIREWLPQFSSALLVHDDQAGFRRFLGADPDSSLSLSALCDRQVTLDRSFVVSQPLVRLADRLAGVISPGAGSPLQPVEFAGPEVPPMQIIQAGFYPELLDVVANETAALINTGTSPGEIVILAPYLSDALRFSITSRLQALAIPWRTHRPSRSLNEEPASHALITLAALAHPAWQVHPPVFDLAYALLRSIAGIDLVRAQLLAGIVYNPRELSLSTFDEILPEVRGRITYAFGDRFTRLREWLLAYRQEEPLLLDHFLRRLFGELLSQPGFGFHADLDSVRVVSSLVESVWKFRQALEPAGIPEIGREYVTMLREGVIAAQYLEGWQVPEQDAVLVAPAHTFLMMNQPVDVQFWLDPGSAGWYERLSQPLTHPHVLSRAWDREPPGRLWMDADEVASSHRSLADLVVGLLRRCRRSIHLAIPGLGESGFESRGDLLKAFQQVLQQEGGEP